MYEVVYNIYMTLNLPIQMALLGEIVTFVNLF